jgi:hypothetical protein
MLLLWWLSDARRCWCASARRVCCASGAKPGRDERARPDCDRDGKGSDDGDVGNNLRAVCLVRAIVECVGGVVGDVEDGDGCW